MRATQIEAWTLRVFDQVKQGKSPEDARVELKASWPEAAKAARRMAAHANAARGEPVLWIIGIDEKKGVVPLASSDMATWGAQVRAQFDGVAPTITDLVVPTEDGPVTALLVETDRAPFVVRNPDYGAAGGGAIQFEVPWRSGTAVRSATRAELIRMLTPNRKLPEAEVLGASVMRDIGQTLDRNRNTTVTLQLYLVPASADRVVIPFHRTSCTLRPFGQAEQFTSSRVTLSPPRRAKGGSMQYSSETVSATHSEVLIDGPGEVMLYAYFDIPYDTLPTVDGFEIFTELDAAGYDARLAIQVLASKNPEHASTSCWDQSFNQSAEL